ncbi:hypothetical protein [Nostocoides sp. HKS02]|uniref:hypothetical protein n=1 Tax=Nostocoides sp. HKS02 TaxID=1813880 RepID=UPI0012B50455|nr:hypothetical protein [Tetrasphaera sp. HKS02]QGN59164.1 hypothetical protein GKE56_16155 [Tetrasphaera sp. HKS02]
MGIDDEQTSLAWGRIVLLLVAGLLALILPFVLVTRFLNTSATAGGSTGPPTAAGSGAAHGTSGSVAHPVASTASGKASSGATTTGGALDGATEACRLANLRQQADLAAAAVSLEQFQKHIDAMNLLVAGKITLAVARTYWEQSRVDAGAKAAAFRTADKALSTSKADCPELGPTAACSAPMAQVNAISACVKATRARVAVLERARSAITTWEHHIQDMDMFRAGHLTASQMGAMWTQSWKTGQGQVDTYSAALLAANLVKCPLT